MESAPPSYEKATSVNAWDLIADYIPSDDLCSAALVCQEWHTTFAPHLWGNPASHFGSENDRVYVALTRFKRTLPWASLTVRSLTHTLHLPPAHAEIYNGPHSDWLRQVLERLPNLQSLIVRGLPFFDHSSLMLLKYTQAGASHNRADARLSKFGLRLLDASRCSNVTAAGLCHALSRFDSMLYLDLSWTYPARDHEVLWALRHFPGLQVLKLRGISLRDEDVKVLAQAIGTRVRSLDLRNNQLTDRSVRTLLDSCFTPPTANGSNSRASSGDRSSSLLHYLGAEMLAIYRGEDFEGYLRNAFTTSFISRLAIEDVPEGGITHMYIADNLLTVEGLSGLLRSRRLHVLDAGILKPDSIAHPALVDGNESPVGPFPGAEKLTPVLAEVAGQTLTFLRIDHSLITQEFSSPDVDEVIPGRVELADTSLPGLPTHAFELPDNTEIHELPAQTSPIYELPADPIHVVVSVAIGEPPHETEQEKSDFMKAHRGSVNAPEVVLESFPEVNDSPQDYNLHPDSAEGTLVASPATPSPTATGRPRTYSSLVAQRETRIRSYMAKSKSFHPGVLPCLKTLVLVDVPPFSPTSKTAERLNALIHNCAEEANLARLQVRLDYTMPPGRKEAAKLSNTIKEETRKVFALEQIVMEIARVQPVRRKSLGSAWRHQTTRSMTQDRDSEALWSASETDFSFFSEGEECGLPRSTAPLHVMSGMEVAPPRIEPRAQPLQSVDQALGPQFDVVAKIAEFRKAKKASYQARLSRGETDPDVEGYWDGNIKVVRPSQTTNPMFEDDEEWADCYGNRFSNGYLYR
ncbi:hypothetical protein MBLNU459_g4383t1 [Dothideomycetes sp. NU459]